MPTRVEGETYFPPTTKRVSDVLKHQQRLYNLNGNNAGVIFIDSESGMFLEPDGSEGNLISIQYFDPKNNPLTDIPEQPIREGVTVIASFPGGGQITGTWTPSKQTQ